MCRRKRPAPSFPAASLAVAALLVACVNGGSGRSGAPGGSEPTIEGLWSVEGYGTLFEIGPTSIEVFELTAVSCLKSGRQMSLRSGPGRAWQVALGDDPDAGTLTFDTADSLRLRIMATASYRTLRRVASRPEVCERPAATGPLATFDVFWTTFDEHYPFFELKGVDWDEVRARVRPSITDDTTPAQLFDALAGAIAPLGDAHTFIAAPAIEREFHGLRPDRVLSSGSVGEDRGALEARFARAVEIVQQRYLGAGLESLCQGHLRYGKLPGDLLYVWLDQEGGYTDQPGFGAELETFEAALDTVFASVPNAQGLVLDVRKNYGGSDIHSLALASRLAREEYFAYAKVAVLDPHEPARRTPRQERTVPVSSRPGFHGPVVQLIGPYTISAGETLTQALMGRQPHIVRVGENTQGVFSDVLGRTLPNGWSFGLPNELFLTREGTSFDGDGIPPDVEVPVFRSEDLETGRDPALEKAIELLAPAVR